MAHTSVVGPLAEAHLRHEIRLDPMGSSHSRWSLRERTAGALASGEACFEIAQGPIRKSCPDLPGIDEAPVLVDTAKESAQPDARPGRFRVAADHDLLPLGALDLEPVAASSPPVDGVAPLGNDAFEPEPAGLGEDLGSSADYVVAVPERLGRLACLLEERGQLGLPVLEPRPREIRPVEMEE